MSLPSRKSFNNYNSECPNPVARLREKRLRIQGNAKMEKINTDEIKKFNSEMERQRREISS